jgi:5-methylcytosine-specific restriction endonuclease McrA
MGKTKMCTKCKAELPLEMFGNHKGTKDGLNHRCKNCCRQYYYDNREKTLEDVGKYREKNKEKISEYKKQYYIENKKDIRQYKKKWYQKNRDFVLKRAEQYRIENEEVIKEKKRLYNLNNPGNSNIRAQRYRTRKRKLPATLTAKQWTGIKRDFNNSCAYCGMTEKEHIREFNERLHQEHFIPLSEGGEYSHNNIIPACKSCNSSKQDKDFFEWYPRQEFYNEERKNFILKYLDYKDGNIQQLSIL